MRVFTHYSIRLLAFFGVSAVLSGLPVLASPPYPGKLDDSPAGKLHHHKAASFQRLIKQQEICSPESFFGKGKAGVATAAGESPKFLGTFNALAILVKFSDHGNSVQPEFFDTLVFGTSGSTVREYYDEISYGQLDMVTVNLPSSIGWKTAPEPYSYYVDGQGGLGSYPNNTQKLVEDLVDIVDSDVDFSDYDNDGDGWMDVLVVIHTGSGAEYTYNNNDIHSHKWGISPVLRDGVYVSSYTIQPEFWASPGDMTTGVYAHELGHGFGLPDLYDTDYSSNGVGKWCLMAYGAWNGPSALGGSPAHPSAWARIQMGFASPINITGNTNNKAIKPVATSGEIYRVWNSGTIEDEYFLIENRQKILQDTYLPGGGLLIWHIDDAKSGNTQEWYPTKSNLQDSQHYLVALEQADAEYHLEDTSHPGSNYADGADPFPGTSGNTTFNSTSSPSSDSYTDGTSFVSVDNITVEGDTIRADLLVGFASAVDENDEGLLPHGIDLEQNYPNPFNPTTTIAIEAEQPARIQLDIYNITGQRVKRLYDGPISSGLTEFEWNGRDEDDRRVASGIYFYRLQQNERVESRRMVLLK